MVFGDEGLERWVVVVAVVVVCASIHKPGVSLFLDSGNYRKKPSYNERIFKVHLYIQGQSSDKHWSVRISSLKLHKTYSYYTIDNIK